MAAHRMSIKDLAKQLNLSASTVSRALAGLPSVSQATQLRVRKLARQLNFQVNILAAGLRKGRTGVIGVIVPQLTGSFFPEVLHSISTAASQAKLRVIICESNEDEQQEEQQLLWLLTAQVDGLLVCAANVAGSTNHFEVARQQGVPVVFFNQVANWDIANSVVLNNCRGAYEGVRHLTAQGRTRIAFFTGPQHLPRFSEHQNGYAEALRKQGLPMDKRLVQIGYATLAAGRQHMEQLLVGSIVPDALFVSQDVVAIGAMQVIKEHGLRIPEDIAVVAFSTESIAMLAAPTLTSLDWQSAEMGKAAVRLLLNLLADSAQDTASQCVTLHPKLLVRASSIATSLATEANRLPLAKQQVVRMGLAGRSVLGSAARRGG